MKRFLKLSVLVTPLLYLATVIGSSSANAGDCDSIEHYRDLKERAIDGLRGDERSGSWRNRLGPDTPFVRVHTFREGQLQALISGRPIRSRMTDFLIKNASGTTNEWYSAFKELRAPGSSSLGIQKGMTGHQVLRNRFWEEVDGVWRRKADFGTTAGTGDVAFPVSAWGPADTGYVDRFRKNPDTGLIVFKPSIMKKLGWGNPSVMETEMLLPLQIDPKDVDKIVFSDGSIKRPLGPQFRTRSFLRSSKVFGGGALLEHTIGKEFPEIPTFINGALSEANDRIRIGGLRPSDHVEQLGEYTRPRTPTWIENTANWAANISDGLHYIFVERPYNYIKYGSDLEPDAYGRIMY